MKILYVWRRERFKPSEKFLMKLCKSSRFPIIYKKLWYNFESVQVERKEKNDSSPLILLIKNVIKILYGRRKF